MLCLNLNIFIMFQVCCKHLMTGHETLLIMNVFGNDIVLCMLVNVVGGPEARMYACIEVLGCWLLI